MPTNADVTIHLIHRRGFDEVVAVSTDAQAACAQLLRVAAALVAREIMPSIAPGAWQPVATAIREYRCRFTVDQEELDGGDLRFDLEDLIEGGDVDEADPEIATVLASEKDSAEVGLV